MSVQAGVKKNGVTIKCTKQFVAEEKGKVQRSIVSHQSSCRATVRLSHQQGNKDASDPHLKKTTWNCTHKAQLRRVLPEIQTLWKRSMKYRRTSANLTSAVFQAVCTKISNRVGTLEH